MRRQEQTARNNGWLPEWKSEVRFAEVFAEVVPPPVTHLSRLALASEGTRGRPLLCSVARGTHPFAGRKTALMVVGHQPHSDDMSVAFRFLEKPPEEP